MSGLNPHAPAFEMNNAAASIPPQFSLNMKPEDLIGTAPNFTMSDYQLSQYRMSSIAANNCTPNFPRMVPQQQEDGMRQIGPPNNHLAGIMPWPVNLIPSSDNSGLSSAYAHCWRPMAHIEQAQAPPSTVSPWPPQQYNHPPHYQAHWMRQIETPNHLAGMNRARQLTGMDGISGPGNRGYPAQLPSSSATGAQASISTKTNGNQLKKEHTQFPQSTDWSLQQPRNRPVHNQEQWMKQTRNTSWRGRRNAAPAVQRTVSMPNVDKAKKHWVLHYEKRDEEYWRALVAAALEKHPNQQIAESSRPQAQLGNGTSLTLPNLPLNPDKDFADVLAPSTRQLLDILSRTPGIEKCPYEWNDSSLD